MQMAFIGNRHEARALAFSLGILIFSVLAIVSFILSGAGIVFYLFALLAIAVGFYMAYHLSKAPAEAAKAKRKRARKR